MHHFNESKINFFQLNILKWYANNKREYYWRKHNLSNYQYIIAEVLLQRTKADTVAKFYPAFITKFPSWLALVKANLEDIAEFLRPIGLYTQRAKRLQLLAIEMIKRKGQIPSDRSELESIPFMGQYIANAVELIIFNKPSPLIDVNMARVLERFFEPRKLADIRYDPNLQQLAYRIVDHSNAKEISWAILDFAALICQARKPKCNSCILRASCTYYLNYESSFPTNNRRSQSRRSDK